MNTLFIMETTDFKPMNRILHNIFTFLYFLAHQTGIWIIKLVQAIFPNAVFLNSMVDPIGFLVILTVFMLLVGLNAARKIVWIVVCAAWILLLIRILMIVLKIG